MQNSPVNDKHNALGGDAGLLGPAIEDEKRTPDNVGIFRRYKNGMIYFTPTTGAHEIHSWRPISLTDLSVERDPLSAKQFTYPSFRKMTTKKE